MNTLYIEDLQQRTYPKTVYHRSATGYGKKLNTGKQVLYANKWRVIWCDVFSNVGVTYIMVNNTKLYIR